MVTFDGDVVRRTMVRDTIYTKNITVSGTFSSTGPVSVAISALTAGDAYSGMRSVVGVANASNSYGSAAYFESDITGTQAGEFHYVSGSWANVNSGTVGAGKYLCAQDNGVWEAVGATITGAKIIYGMRMEAILGDTDALVFPFSSNNNNQPITALFDCNNITDLGTTAVSKTTTSTYLPIARDAGGNLRYVLLYS